MIPFIRRKKFIYLFVNSSKGEKNSSSVSQEGVSDPHFVQNGSSVPGVILAYSAAILKVLHK